MKSVAEEFREFIARGNVVDMAVGIAVGTAFGAIARSLVNDVVMPVVGLLLGHADFTDLFIVLREGTPAGPYPTLVAAESAGAVAVKYGLFLNAVLTFLIIAAVVFVLVRSINSLRRRQEGPPPPPAEEKCPFCRMPVSVEAIRCPHCTSELRTGD